MTSLSPTPSPCPGLRYADCSRPGISRRSIADKGAGEGAGKGAGEASFAWHYIAADGKRIRRKLEIARLDAIALPPAYTHCWFSPDPDVHILATGLDARGRKQYRYHPEWRSHRDARKFEDCLAFGAALPALRAQVAEDLAGRGLHRHRVIASVVALLDTGAIRVGNERYARENRSFGATTLRQRHARIEKGHLLLHFKGKSGRTRTIDCTDPVLVRCVRRMQDLPGQHLFQYRDADGAVHPVHSHDVNDYLGEAMGAAFTAKQFRTFTASAMAFARFWHDREVTLGEVLREVAEQLGNTPAVARTSYVHPSVIAAVKGEIAPAGGVHLPRKTRWMTREERGFLAFLQGLPDS